MTMRWSHCLAMGFCRCASVHEARVLTRVVPCLLAAVKSTRLFTASGHPSPRILRPDRVLLLQRLPLQASAIPRQGAVYNQTALDDGDISTPWPTQAMFPRCVARDCSCRRRWPRGVRLASAWRSTLDSHAVCDPDARHQQWPAARIAMACCPDKAVLDQWLQKAQQRMHAPGHSDSVQRPIGAWTRCSIAAPSLSHCGVRCIAAQTARPAASEPPQICIPIQEAAKSTSSRPDRFTTGALTSRS